MKVLNFVRGMKYMLLSALTLLSVACTSGADYTLGYWHQRSDFDGKARSGAAYFTIGNTGYIVGGYNEKAARMKSMYSYNMDNNSYTLLFSDDATATMPGARQYATGFAVGTKGYVSCGYNANSGVYMADTWQYDPSTNTWTQMDDVPGEDGSGQRYGALAFGIGNYGYLGCGYNENYLKDFYKLDPSAAAGSQWTKIIGYGGSKRLFGMYFMINNVAYIVGGKNNNKDCEDFWKFDGTTWTQLRDIANTDEDNSYDDDYTSIVRNAGVAFSYGGKGYVALGQTISGSYRSNYWIYTPSTDLWSDNDGDVTAFEGSTRVNAVCLTNGTKIFVATGNSGSSSFFDDTWEFAPNEEKEK
jgi:N-acetylneuraminic acid mutarotase